MTLIHPLLQGEVAAKPTEGERGIPTPSTMLRMVPLPLQLGEARPA